MLLDDLSITLSIVIQNGGKASKRKRVLVESLSGANVLNQVEVFAARLISDIKSKFEVDVVAMMNGKSQGSVNTIWIAVARRNPGNQIKTAKGT